MSLAHDCLFTTRCYHIFKTTQWLEGTGQEPLGAIGYTRFFRDFDQSDLWSLRGKGCQITQKVKQLRAVCRRGSGGSSGRGRKGMEETQGSVPAQPPTQKVEWCLHLWQWVFCPVVRLLS